MIYLIAGLYVLLIILYLYCDQQFRKYKSILEQDYVLPDEKWIAPEKMKKKLKAYVPTKDPDKIMKGMVYDQFSE